MKTSVIVAKSANNVIGKDNKLPWHLPADLKHFKKKTSGHVVIMGRKTYESIGAPLPERVNVVLSTQKNLQIDGCVVCGSLKEALDYAKHGGEKEVFVIGGAKVFEEALRFADVIYLTEINQTFDGDVFFPEFSTAEWKETARFDCYKDDKNAFDYSFVQYNRVK